MVWQPMQPTVYNVGFSSAASATNVPDVNAAVAELLLRVTFYG
jgi:hypothetical protein